jgi:hypothetical protein
MKGKLQINPVTQKFEVKRASGIVYPLREDYQGWTWLNEGQEVDYHLTIKTTYDDSKCKCKDKSYEDTLTCKHFIGGGINDCMEIESTMYKVAALEWPRMTPEEMKTIDAFTLAFFKFAHKYPIDGLTDEEILEEFKELNGLTNPRLW